MICAHLPRRPVWLISLLSLALVLGVASGCSSAPAAEDDAPLQAQTGPVRPGAERWQGHALLLPAGSPAVVWARSDGLFDSLGGLRDWIFAEPAMFGPGGERMIGQAQTEWRAVIAHLGMDPLAPQSWQQMGLATDKEIYVGLYPAEGEEDTPFVTAFDEAFRQGLDLGDKGDTTDLLSALDTMTILPGGELPRGLHNKVASAVSAHEPLLGARAVVPVADREAFFDNIEKLMRGAEYTQVDEGEAGGRSVHFFYDLEGSFPGVLLRLGEETAIFDIVSRQRDTRRAKARDEGREAGIERLRERLQAAVSAFGPGRPAAPKPAERPIVGVGVDQQGAARLAKLRGYRIALERARTAAIAQRDAVLLQDVHSALRSTRNWSIASEKLSGTSYGLFTGTEPDSYFRANVTFFGAPEDAELAVSSAPKSLGVEERGMGLSLDLLPMSNPVWQSFIGVNHAGEILDGFTVADYDPSLFALAFPRSMTVLFANAEKVFEEDVVDSIEPMLEGSEAFRRLEVASAGVDMRGLRVRPRLVGLVLLDDAAAPEIREQLADVVGTALEAMVEEAEGDASLHYYPRTDGQAPYLFFSYGLGKAASEAELAKLSAGEGDETKSLQATRTFFARAEPVALFSLATVFEPDLFAPLDVSILTQRLGALTFSVEPRLVDGVQTIGYDVALEKPPTIE